MNEKRPRVGLIGVGGFARTHLSNAARLDSEGMIDLVAYADPTPGAPDSVAEHCTVPLTQHRDHRSMLAEERLDIAVISTPIPLHGPMMADAFSAGVHVLVEKPPVVTIQDLDMALDRQRAAGVLCQVGFQTARMPVVEALGDLVRSGALGTVDLIGAGGHWLRPDSYYTRAAWAGKLVHQGNYVLDGTVTNPLAHALMNCLLVAGEGRGVSAVPESVRAELYRCRDITSDDTASVRIRTTSGVPIVLAFTVCTEGDQEIPYLFARGSKGSARAYYTAGKIETEGIPAPPVDDGRVDLLSNLVEVVSGSGELLCPLEQSRGFVLSVNGMFESAGAATAVPEEFLDARGDGPDRTVRLRGIDTAIDDCVHSGLLFSEAGLPWARTSEEFALNNYRHFAKFETQ